MAQHFLLSKEAADLDIEAIGQMSEDCARMKFREIVWEATNGKPVCPKCGGLDHSELVEGAKWKCKGKLDGGKACRWQFSPTTDTVFHAHKIRYRKILFICALLTTGVNGVSAMQIRRMAKISYKSAFVLLHRIREAMGTDESASVLGGVVEMDGAVFGCDVQRMPNDRSRWKEVYERNKKAARRRKRLIVVIRERPVVGSGIPDKVRTFLVGKEGDAVEIARKIVTPSSIVHVDFSTQWLPLKMYFETMRIDHSKHYSHEGACTNLAEAFFSRMRTAERGIYKHISGGYLAFYASELGWREQYRRTSTEFQFEQMVGAAGRAKRSGAFKGYWRKRPANDDGGGRSGGPTINDNDDGDDDFFAHFAD